jgi:hypothetical protein
MTVTGSRWYWPALTAEPGCVDYLEIEVAGLPALWAVPESDDAIRRFAEWVRPKLGL